MRLTNEDWKYKIINASPTRLVIVTYEIILDRIEAAEAALEQGDLEGFRQNAENAKEFVSELTASLDMGTPVSINLTDLYIFVNKLLTKAFFSENKQYLISAGEIIKRLKNGLSKEVDDGAHGGVETSGNYSPGIAGAGSVGMRYRRS